MIEKVILNYLSNNLSVNVYMEIPEKPADSFVVIQKTGSREENHIKSATFIIQSYGASLLEASSLNEEVKEYMENLVILPNIGRCKLNSDYNFTDTSTKKYRYQAIFDIVHY